MLAAAHRKAAEDVEATITPLASSPQAARIVIEGAWGAVFHWIAFGCETKHGQHQESHARLTSFLHARGEAAVAGWWDQLDRLRQGGWYGLRTDPASVAQALDLLGEVRTWATT
jgi:hypothetical protein